MSEIRIEKVMNGYIVRCFNEDNHNSYDDTFVYSDFSSAIEFVALQCHENSFVSKFRKAFFITE